MWRRNLGTAYLVPIIGWEYVYQYRGELGDDGDRERATTSAEYIFKPGGLKPFADCRVRYDSPASCEHGKWIAIAAGRASRTAGECRHVGAPAVRVALDHEQLDLQNGGVATAVWCGS